MQLKSKRCQHPVRKAAEKLKTKMTCGLSEFKDKHTCCFRSISSKRKGKDIQTSEVLKIPFDFGL